MKKIFIITGVIIFLGIAWYGLSPLFKNKYVNDALPGTLSKETSSGTTESKTLTGDAKGEANISEPVSIVDTAAHPASGVVRVVKTGSDTIVRYENYKTINGPDVRVYLANDLKAKDFVDLGPIKGTEGNINYAVPDGVDVDTYRYVLTWCEDFSVLFNSADLSTIRKSESR